MGGKSKKAKTAQHDKEVVSIPVQPGHKHGCNDCHTEYYHDNAKCDRIGLYYRVCDVCVEKAKQAVIVPATTNLMVDFPDCEKKPASDPCPEKPLEEHEFIHDDGSCMVGDPPTEQDKVDILINPGRKRTHLFSTGWFGHGRHQNT